MNKPLCIKTTVCSQYQRLLEECESALEIWDEHRAEVSVSRLVGREAGDELLRLQAKFARAYAVLQLRLSGDLKQRLRHSQKKEKSKTPHAKPAYGAPKTYVTDRVWPRGPIPQ